MMRVVTASGMRALEREAETRHGQSVAVLMERAGSALAEEALRLSGEHGRFFVFAGPGNNGGDGLVAARVLNTAGRRVFVQVAPDVNALKGEPARNLAALRAGGLEPASVPAGLRAGDGDVLIDALLGTGVNRAPAGALAECIERIAQMRAQGARVLAADLPSGLDADSGRLFEPHVRADATVSFGFPKVGQVLEPGAGASGALRVADIGIPAEALGVLEEAALFLLEEADAVGLLPVRAADSHKGSYGHVLVVAGSHGKTGAAALASLAVLRAGAGLVTVAARKEAVPAVLAHSPELMGAVLEGTGPLGMRDAEALLALAKGKAALVIGPGIPRGAETKTLLRHLLERLEIPVVLDADALNAVADDLSMLRASRAPLLLTPHPGEMSRLTNQPTARVQENRLPLARAFATEHGVTLVLKGARTLIATRNGSVFVNPTGNPGMSTGGTGDVLAGMLGALLAQGLTPRQAALTGVFAHGLAGDLVAKETGRMGLIASDLLPALGRVWSRWGR